ncbi:Growth arrest-specific protein 7 [Varanus komodoensis]|nr:Growth arrest-specific protein 7 [Varanus komodoensis]
MPAGQASRVSWTVQGNAQLPGTVRICNLLRSEQTLGSFPAHLTKREQVFEQLWFALNVYKGLGKSTHGVLKKYWVALGKPTVTNFGNPPFQGPKHQQKPRKAIPQVGEDSQNGHLPPGWQSYMSPQGRRYYVNTYTNGKCNVTTSTAISKCILVLSSLKT